MPNMPWCNISSISLKLIHQKKSDFNIFRRGCHKWPSGHFHIFVGAESTIQLFGPNQGNVRNVEGHTQQRGCGPSTTLGPFGTNVGQGIAID